MSLRDAGVTENTKGRTMFTEIEVKPSGTPKWHGGAFCLVWVYSTEGNFLLRGFGLDCENYIKSKGWKCWAVINRYHGKVALTDRIAYWRRPKALPGYSTTINTFKCDFNIYTPNTRKKTRGRLSAKDFKYTLFKSGSSERLNLKRLPSRFVDFTFPDTDYSKPSTKKRRKI